MASHAEHSLITERTEHVSHSGVPYHPLDLSSAHARFDAALGRAREHWQRLEPGLPPRALPMALDAALVRAEVRTATGAQLRLAPELRQGPHYELRVLGPGQLAYRSGVWHDWFNALCWLTWPNAKAALNFRHCLHYTACLIRHHPQNWTNTFGAKVPRDRWMQMLANLDEGGCVIERTWLRQTAQPDAARVMRWREPPSAAALESHMSWFGHAVLELLRNACTAGFPSQPSVEPRMFILEVDTLNDATLASRILTCAPELEPELEGARAALETLGWKVTPEVLASISYAESDPFLGPSFSLYCPWSGA